MDTHFWIPCEKWYIIFKAQSAVKCMDLVEPEAQVEVLAIEF